MVRVKRSVNARKKRKNILKSTKGYRSKNSKVYKMAKQAWMKAGLHAYVGRKLKKRDFRQLWIARISAGLKQLDPTMKYSRLIGGMTQKNVKLNRKVLADLALHHEKAFEAVVKEVYPSS